ncbi:MAG TPA: NAD(P)H-hydrate epimerase, partial [Thermoplasmata archaeon]
MATDELGPTSPTETRVVEANALALGLSVDALMENAGRAVAEAAAAHLPPVPARVVILAGVGNNGGDGTAAAFFLGQWGFAPEVWLVRPSSEIRGSSARRCWDRARSRCTTHLGVPSEQDLDGAPLAIDALLGSGQSGPLRSPYRDAVATLVRSKVPVLSVDVPTGLGGPDAVRPRWTVALTARKEGMTSENSGEISIRDIGIPAEAWQRTGPGEFLRFPTPVGRGARGRNGRVLVIAGGPYSGAPALAGLAALRSGAERATIATPSPAADAVRAASPDLVVHTLGTEAFAPADLSPLARILDEGRVTSIVLGMGAGRSEETLEFFRRFLTDRRGQVPMVVDADALAALTPTPGGSDRTVATPNEGEYERVFGRDPSASWPDRLDAARRHAMAWGLTLLAKGEADRITDGRRAHLNLHHHP